MPELPDVELFRRYLDETCKGRVIQHVAVNDPKILTAISSDDFAARLKGAHILSSQRHGKHLLVRLSPAGWLTMHFGMSGALRYLDAAEVEPSYTRIRFDFADGHHLAYIDVRRLGAVGLAGDPESFSSEHQLGPDALDPRFDLAAFEQILAGQRRDIKSVLMDQAAIAGIGNIYSDEILFQAGIHPKRRADKLGRDDRKRLFRQVKHVLETAVERGAGAELSVDALPRSFLLPQRKKGGRCPRCGSEIHAIKLSGRTAYYCPHCQVEAG